MKKYYALLLMVFSLAAYGQDSPYKANDYFEQMGTALPTPNTYRSASGAPGRDYWQQRADYTIKVELDDVNQRLTGSETITYFNNSPEPLRYLWLQLDQNRFKDDATGKITRSSDIDTKRGESMRSLNGIEGKSDKPYGYNITSVLDASKRPLKHTINGTMMRVDLPSPLATGQKFVFSVDWNHNIVEVRAQGGRGGYEFFEKDGNYLYEMAQWFPRMCVYDDVNGWQNKQFLGQGEFALVFGNYEVAITAPNDMVVGATGELQDMDKLLSKEMRNRLKQAESSSIPVLIVSQSEAEAAEKGKPTGTKTWVFKAENVRDFAFAASRKFIWDAMKVNVEGKSVWAMSLYPKEANPLWGQYSTRVVAHTLTSYSKRSVAYPYPVAYSVHGPIGGMEYPMMSFNGARPEEDGTYSEGTKNFLILVVIHEVGHNFFPMIVNSDERQWSWMDEGINSFLEGLACLEWDRDFPATGIQPQSIVRYMKTDADKQNPIMSSSDNIVPGTFGPNAYSKPATGLNILRETVMGRELFDFAFKEYSRRWAFKHPQPADFFRTMEDASGVDLDWFWKGWFYGVEAADQAIADVEWYSLDDQNPEVAKAAEKQEDMARKETMSNIRNRTDIKQTVVEADPTMWDFYNSYDPYKATEAEKKKYQEYIAGLSADERKAIDEKKNFYVLKLKNKGGLMMPVIVQMTYDDGTTEVVRYPAEIWRMNSGEISKTIATTKKVTKFKLDPFYEIPDIDTSDNAYPREPEQPTKFQLYKNNRSSALNPMQEAKQSGGAATGTN